MFVYRNRKFWTVVGAGFGLFLLVFVFWLVGVSFSSVVPNTLMAYLTGTDSQSHNVVNKSEFQKNYQVSVKATPAVKRPLEMTMESYGTFVYYDKLKVSTTRAGKVKKLMVDHAGQRVQAGDTIAVLQQFGLRVGRTKALINKRERQINYNIRQAEQSSLQTKIKKARANYLSSREELRFTQRQYQNNLKLFQINAVTEQKLLQSAHERFQAVSALLNARLNLIQLKRQRSQINQQVELARVRINEAEQTVRRKNYQLRQTVVRAPVNGVVASKNISQGEVLKSGGNTLVTLMNVNRIFLEVKVPETDIPKVHNKQVVHVNPDAYPSMNLKGRVTNIEPVVNPQNRSLNVKILLENPDRKLKPGMFAQAEFRVNRRPNAVTIPRKAIVRSPDTKKGEAQVYVVNEGVAVSRTVTLAGGNEEYVQVKDGVSQGDLVVVNGQNRLNDYVQVKPNVVDNLDV
jgi:RND family efflux transporter MFP subunit